VDILHVNSNRKNAADDKLKDLMRRFADLHGTESSIILISGQHIFLLALMRRFADLHGTESSIILISGQHIFQFESAAQTGPYELLTFTDKLQWYGTVPFFIHYHSLIFFLCPSFLKLGNLLIFKTGFRIRIRMDPH
jgi:hypothetical protein